MRAVKLIIWVPRPSRLHQRAATPRIPRGQLNRAAEAVVVGGGVECLRRWVATLMVAVTLVWR